MQISPLFYNDCQLLITIIFNHELFTIIIKYDLLLLLTIIVNYYELNCSDSNVYVILQGDQGPPGSRGRDGPKGSRVITSF